MKHIYLRSLLGQSDKNLYNFFSVVRANKYHYLFNGSHTTGTGAEGDLEGDGGMTWTGFAQSGVI